jgi:hypothetical protein
MLGRWAVIGSSASSGTGGGTVACRRVAGQSAQWGGVSPVPGRSRASWCARQYAGRGAGAGRPALRRRGRAGRQPVRRVCGSRRPACTARGRPGALARHRARAARSLPLTIASPARTRNFGCARNWPSCGTQITTHDGRPSRISFAIFQRCCSSSVSTAASCLDHAINDLAAGRR